MSTGIIKVRKEAGFGFITPDEGGKDVFFHVKELARGCDESMAVEGARVEYEVRQGDRGLMGIRVRILSAASEPESAGCTEPDLGDYTEEEAWAGLREAQLAVLEWTDILDRLRKARA